MSGSDGRWEPPPDLLSWLQGAAGGGRSNVYGASALCLMLYIFHLPPVDRGFLPHHEDNTPQNRLIAILQMGN